MSYTNLLLAIIAFEGFIGIIIKLVQMAIIKKY